jgi:hypothetical protein
LGAPSPLGVNAWPFGRRLDFGGLD